MAGDLPAGNTWTRQITAEGAFSRQPTGFHAEIGHGPEALHPAEPGRYHLYVSLACPWAHRTLIVRALKGLEHVLSVDVVHPHLTEKGWSFDTERPWVGEQLADPGLGPSERLGRVYDRCVRELETAALAAPRKRRYGI